MRLLGVETISELGPHLVSLSLDLDLDLDLACTATPKSCESLKFLCSWLKANLAL